MLDGVVSLAEDEADLEVVVHDELPRVERLLRRILGRRDDMEDLVQSVFVELCASLPRFRGESSISTFVASIAIRIARRAMRPTAWVRRVVPLLDEPRDLASSPEALSVESEALERVRRALEGVKPVKRIAFLLWALEGLSVEAIAELMGASPSATRSRIFTAQRELFAKARRDPVLRDIVGEAP